MWHAGGWHVNIDSVDCWDVDPVSAHKLPATTQIEGHGWANS